MKVLFFSVFLMVSSICSQTANISGTVSDGAGAPIEGAVIQLSGAGLSAVSGVDGSYIISGPLTGISHPGALDRTAYNLSYHSGTFTLSSPPGDSQSQSARSYRQAHS